MKTWAKDTSYGNNTEAVKKLYDFSQNFSDIFDKIILFGSTARGEATNNSDVDIYVESESMTSTQLARSNRLKEFILGLYKLDVASEFDILSFGRNELKNLRKSTLWKQIEKDGVVFYDKRANSI